MSTDTVASDASMTDGALDEAIAWAVRLKSGCATGDDHAACERWRRERAAHEIAWQQVQAVERDFAVPAPSHLAFDTLQRAQHQRKRFGARRGALRALGWGAALAGIAAASGHWLNTAEGMQGARFATAPGQRRRETLADGTQLALNADSQVEVHLSLTRRTVVLHRGEIFIDTGRDDGAPLGRRAFWVEAADVRFEALGTRFGVQRLQAGIEPSSDALLHVSEGRVAAHARADSDPVIAKPGDTLRIHAGSGRVERLAPSGLEPGAWRDGVLVARQTRLDALAAELSRYRQRPVGCAPSVAALRVSGVFQLDGPDPVGRALHLLTRTLPVKLAAPSGWRDELVPV
jgi:transmembrane sensor